MSKKKAYNKCPYCAFISQDYQLVKAHVNVFHPSEAQIIEERYVEDIHE